MVAMILNYLLLSVVLIESNTARLGDDIRQDRSGFDEDDPKEHFFRYMKSLKFDGDNSDGTRKVAHGNSDIPRPGGFSNRKFRSKRSENSTRNTTDIISSVIEKQLGKPLELSILVSNGTDNESSNKTENPFETTTIEVISSEESVNNNILINDFIRFRRDTSESADSKPKNHLEDDIETLNETSIKNVSSDGNRPKRNHLPENSQSQKIQLDNANTKQAETGREARGATTEQWTKHLYPTVRRADDAYEDNSPASSELVRAPRVHFVTQRRSETPPTSGYRSYDREARARNLNKELTRDLSRDLSREMDFYYQPRYTRHYNPEPAPPPLDRSYHRYDNNYYRFDSPRDLYDRGHQDNYYTDRDRDIYRDRNLYSSTKPKRIIYYATLPDISRTPPNVDLRDRYNYRQDRYEDKYANLPTGDPYRMRKAYPMSRYEPIERSKGSPYPLKVSTDVNVREIKKNPERRIYSDVDRSRYAFKPYPNERN